MSVVVSGGLHLHLHVDLYSVVSGGIIYPTISGHVYRNIILSMDTYICTICGGICVCMYLVLISGDVYVYHHIREYGTISGGAYLCTISQMYVSVAVVYMYDCSSIYTISYMRPNSSILAWSC